MPDRIGPGPRLEGEYERLRQRALCGTCMGTPGYGLLLQRGMLVWMRSLTAGMPLVEPPPVTSPASSANSSEVLAPGLEAELVQLLTALILSSQVNCQLSGAVP